MTRGRHPLRLSVVALALALGVAGCDVGPKKIRYGEDECAECKMTLVDRHYGAELITTKGKVFVFDDISCLRVFQRRDTGRLGADARLFVIDFERPNTFLPVAQAVFLHHERLRAPMGSELAAFANETELQAVRDGLGGGGGVLRWADVLATP